MTGGYHLNALPAGTMLHEYEVLRVLGEGSFGIVYLTKGRYLDDLLAIKEYLPADLATRVGGTTVTPTSSGNEEFFHWGRKKFLEEARLLHQLANPQPHPNIVAVRRFFELHDTAYLVMDFVEGEPLSERLARERQLPEAQVREMLDALIDGLAMVHAAGITHRDIKPGNIFIREDGSPVLLDFGAARVALGEQTKSSFSALSPAFAAPEQLLSSDRVGPWTDVYGLAATLYRAVTGQMPRAAVERLVDDNHVAAAELVGDRYSQELLNAIDTGLRLRAEDRPQTVSQWHALLDGAAPIDDVTVIKTAGKREKEPLILRSEQRAPSPAEVSPLRAGTAGGARSAMGAGAASSDGIQAAAAQAPDAKRRQRTLLAAAVVAISLIAVVAGGGAFLIASDDSDETLAAVPSSEEALPETEELAPVADELVQQRVAEEAEAKRLAEEAERQRLAEEVRRLEADAERQRLAEEQRLREAEAERQRLADEQRRLAEEAERQRRLAEEQRRLAAEAEAQRQAEEQRRLAAEAEAQRQAEEQRRLAAEAEAQRQAEELRRQVEAAEARLLAEEQKRQAAQRGDGQQAALTDYVRAAEILRGKKAIEAFIQDNRNSVEGDFRNFMVDKQVLDTKERFRRVLAFGPVSFESPDYTISVEYIFCVRLNNSCQDRSERGRFRVRLEPDELTFDRL